MRLKQKIWLTKEDAHYVAIQVVGPKRDDIGDKLVVEVELLMVEDWLEGDVSNLHIHWQRSARQQLPLQQKHASSSS